MCEDLREHGWRITTGNLCTLYLLEMLSEYGYVDDAWKVMTREEYPSLGYMLQQEATTVWERFELMEDATMNSHNHPMYASVDRWLYAYIAGCARCRMDGAAFALRPNAGSTSELSGVA